MPRYAVRPGVMARELGDETVLLDTVSGAYFRLNETGAFVWSRLASPASVDELASELAATADVDVETVQRDVAELLEALESRGLVSETE